MRHPHQDLANLDARARKKLSQNFLVSPHWRIKLTEAVLGLPAYDEIWEIGPGLGALTELLVEKAKQPIRLFEYDRKLCERLKQVFPQLTLIEGDFLKANLPEHLQQKKIALLSNTPYHLSSPILFSLIPFQSQFSGLVLTFQKEFADRLIAKPRSKEYGALTVLLQLTFEMKSLGVLPKGAFFPPPKVDSRALILIGKPMEVDFESLSEVTHLAFLHRRKKLSSNLKERYPAEIVFKTLSDLGIGENARSEEISPPTFARLTSQLISDTPKGH